MQGLTPTAITAVEKNMSMLIDRLVHGWMDLHDTLQHFLYFNNSRI